MWGSDGAGRRRLDRVGDQAGRSGDGPDRLDPASGSHGDNRRACRHHGREYLERTRLDGADAGGVAGAVAEGGVPVIHTGHRVSGGILLSPGLWAVLNQCIVQPKEHDYIKIGAFQALWGVDFGTFWSTLNLRLAKTLPAD